MNYKLIFSAFLMGGIIACNQPSSGGYETAESGLQYHFYKKSDEGVKPKMGDYVKLIMSYKTSKDSILFDSQKMSQDGSNAIEFPLGKSTFKGSFEEALMMMSVGDSASFKISADSVYLKTFGAPEIPAYIEKGTLLTFEAKLVNIKTKEDAAKESQEMQLKQQAQMEQRKSIEPQEIAKYVADNKITVSPTASGLYYIEKVKGKGEKVVAGKTVTANYKGMLVDGKVFDSSEGKPPFEFPVGEGKVIKGWEEAFLMMNVGSKATLIIPSSIAYGEMGAGQGIIPPYAPLVFEVEVLSIK